jgi:hypothetical protein
MIRIGAICVMVMFSMVLRPTMLTAQEAPDAYWPVLAGGDWECGIRGLTIRRTSQGIHNHAMWESFHVRISDGKFSPAPPRKIVLTYDTNTDRFTINGKRCREVKEQQEHAQ